MPRRLTMNLSTNRGEGSIVTRPSGSLRQVDVGKKFRMMIFLVVCLFALSAVQMIWIVNRTIEPFLNR